MQHSPDKQQNSAAQTAEHFLKFVDHLQILDRESELRENLLNELNHSLSNMKDFFRNCDPKDPNVIRLAKLLKSEINKVASQNAIGQSNQIDDSLFGYFSKLSEEFDVINSRVDPRPVSGNLANSSLLEHSGLYSDFYRHLNRDPRRASTVKAQLEESQFQVIYDNLERTYKPRLVSMGIEDNGNVNEGLEALLEGFSGFLQQVRGTLRGATEHVKKSFEGRVAAFEGKWGEVLRHMILGNVKLEARRQRTGGELFFRDKVSPGTE